MFSFQAILPDWKTDFEIFPFLNCATRQPAFRPTGSFRYSSIQRHAMNNIIELPSRRFIQWGAIAQEISFLLRSIGATKKEAALVVEQMRITWQQCDATPPPGNDQSSRLYARKTKKPQEGMEEKSSIFASRQMHSLSAKTLLRLATAEYRRLLLDHVSSSA
jgi:hypothetical protein